MPTETRSTISWGMGPMVGERQSQVFMGPENRAGQKVFAGIDGISATPQERRSVIHQTETKAQIRDVMRVGSARGTTKRNRKTSMF